MLDDRVGYVYVRRVGNDLVDQLDRAVAELKDAKAMIVDVRGNSGGGFDAEHSFRNFDVDDKAEPNRPRVAGPMAVLIDSRCISAGEGWASWFVAKKRARFFGEATAGASSRKRQYVLMNGLYTVTIPVKAYTGFLDRPIERRGLEPDEPVKAVGRRPGTRARHGTGGGKELPEEIGAVDAIAHRQAALTSDEGSCARGSALVELASTPRTYLGKALARGCRQGPNTRMFPRSLRASDGHRSRGRFSRISSTEGVCCFAGDHGRHWSC